MEPGSCQDIWDRDGLIPLMHTCPLPWFLFFFLKFAAFLLLYYRPEGGVNGWVEGEQAGPGSRQQLTVTTC